MRYYDEQKHEHIDEGKLFKRLAVEIFKPDQWSSREVKLLKKLGLLSWFGLSGEVPAEALDFFEDFPFETKSRKNDWL